MIRHVQVETTAEMSFFIFHPKNPQLFLLPFLFLNILSSLCFCSLRRRQRKRKKKKRQRREKLLAGLTAEPLEFAFQEVCQSVRDSPSSERFSAFMSYYIKKDQTYCTVQKNNIKPYMCYSYAFMKRKNKILNYTSVRLKKCLRCADIN